MSLFVSCDRLERIIISHNELYDIPIEVFCIQSLLMLDLSHNQVTKLTSSDIRTAKMTDVNQRNANAYMTGNSIL